MCGDLEHVKMTFNNCANNGMFHQVINVTQNDLNLGLITAVRGIMRCSNEEKDGTGQAYATEEGHDQHLCSILNALSKIK